MTSFELFQLFSNCVKKIGNFKHEKLDALKTSACNLFRIIETVTNRFSTHLEEMLICSMVEVNHLAFMLKKSERKKKAKKEKPTNR